jgi:hypothetical protein
MDTVDERKATMTTMPCCACRIDTADQPSQPLRTTQSNRQLRTGFQARTSLTARAAGELVVDSSDEKSAVILSIKHVGSQHYSTTPGEGRRRSATTGRRAACYGTVLALREVSIRARHCCSLLTSQAIADTGAAGDEGGFAADGKDVGKRGADSLSVALENHFVVAGHKLPRPLGEQQIHGVLQVTGCKQRRRRVQ